MRRLLAAVNILAAILLCAFLLAIYPFAAGVVCDGQKIVGLPCESRFHYNVGYVWIFLACLIPILVSLWACRITPKMPALSLILLFAFPVLYVSWAVAVAFGAT